MSDVISTQYILEEIRNIEPDFEGLFNEDRIRKTRCLFYGITDSGKTTIFHLLSECLMESVRIPENINKVLKCRENCRIPNIIIGHTCNSETIFPNYITISNKLLLDLPGIEDNRSINQRIINAFTINQLLAPPCKVKIMLVMTQHSFCEAKGKLALEFLKEAEQFFVDYEQMEQCVGLIMTKMEPDTTARDTLEYLNKDDIINRSPLLKFFLEHPERCFHVFKPTNLGPYYDFEDKDRIISFLESGEVENPRHRIILDENTKQTLCIESIRRNNDLNQYLINFAENLESQYQSINEFDELNECINTIEGMKYNASRGFEAFYHSIRECDRYEELRENLQQFSYWDLLVKRVLLQVSIPNVNQFLFNFNQVIAKFDEIINNLREKRINIQNQIQLRQDETILTLFNEINTIITTGGVVHDHEYHFFDFLRKHPELYCEPVEYFDAIQYEQTRISDNEIQGKMKKESVLRLISQMEKILIYVMINREIIKTEDVARLILSRMRNTEQDPDDMEEFKKYKDSVGNNIVSHFEIFSHPLTCATSIPVGISFCIQKICKKERDIRNIDKFIDWSLRGTRMNKNHIYQISIAPMLRKYREIVKLSYSDYSISFSYYNSGAFDFPFFNCHLIIPNNSIQMLFSHCQSMTNIIHTANDSNSMDVFNGIRTLYLQVCGEIVQRRIEMNGYEILQQIMVEQQEDNINTVLSSLSFLLMSTANHTNDIVAIYSYILATTRFICAINGRGQRSHERKNLFGLMTTVNCQSENGNIFLYSRKNVEQINERIFMYVIDRLFDIGICSEQDISRFTTENFVRLTREIINTSENECNEARRELIESVESLFNLFRINENNEENEHSSNGISNHENLLNRINNIIGVEVEEQQNNNANVHINGSIFNLSFSTLISFLPQIRQAIIASEKYRNQKKIFDDAYSLFPLIRFYHQTKNHLTNNNVHGIIVNVENNCLISIEQIEVNNNIFLN